MYILYFHLFFSSQVIIIVIYFIHTCIYVFIINVMHTTLLFVFISMSIYSRISDTILNIHIIILYTFKINDCLMSMYIIINLV